MLPIKLVLVGAPAVKKTKLLISYSEGLNLGKDYIPTVFDNYKVDLLVDDVNMNLGLWDTAGQEEYGRLRPLSYANTDILVVAFSIRSPASFEEARALWVPEIKHFCPTTPIILLGTHSEVRDDEKKIEKLAQKQIKPITRKQGEELAKEIRAEKLF